MQNSTDELEEFRRKWREEVKSRNHLDHYSVESLRSSDNSNEKDGSFQSVDGSTAGTVEQVVSQPESTLADLEESKVEKGSAMDYYVLAVDKERQGNLGKALANYRKAFHLDRNVDYKYKQHYQTHIAPTIAEGGAADTSAHSASGLDSSDTQRDEDFQHVVQYGREYVPPKSRQDPLDELIEDFQSQSLEYIPADEEKPVLISILPNEVIVHMLQHVILESVTSVHSFALVCKKFLLLTRSQSIWRSLCEYTYHTHDISKETSDMIQLDFVNRLYDGDWMKMFIERPRIRFDGIYISTCHYIRPGSSETAWNQPIHLVTYYRYIRFFPDGTIMKYLSTDEPIHVVHSLTKTFKGRQVFHGRYELEDANVTVSMRDKETRATERFQMKLFVKSTHRGRHNKLAWEEYVSWSDVRGDKTTYNLKHMKPYYFSVVRSYTY
ncbi:hypothetical protein NQZ79_g7679 [Umbelopsis isabellina]|nr:hypothetical protein NQZ79_g7679 [Umbelopsis isabellina]